MRSALVFNLTKYASWPERHEYLVITILGTGDMGPVLKRMLDGKIGDGRPIIVLLHPTDAELRDCDLLYVEESQPDRIRAILDRIQNRPVLTVGDCEQFVRAGGMVGLVRSGDQIEIQVNIKALRSHHLELSSRLLNLALIVPGGEVR